MIEYSDIQTAVVVIVLFCATVVTIDKFVEIVKKMIKPKSDIDKRFDEYDMMFAEDHKKDLERDEAIRLLIRGMSQLMTHEIDGNHVDQLTKTRDDMNEFLINQM